MLKGIWLLVTSTEEGFDSGLSSASVAEEETRWLPAPIERSLVKSNLERRRETWPFLPATLGSLETSGFSICGIQLTPHSHLLYFQQEGSGSKLREGSGSKFSEGNIYSCFRRTVNILHLPPANPDSLSRTNINKEILSLRRGRFQTAVKGASWWSRSLDKAGR